MKSICRGICFITTAFAVVCFLKSLPLWMFFIVGGVIGLTAGIGWEDEKDKS